MYISYGYTYCVVTVIFEHAQLCYVIMCFWERRKVIVFLLKRGVLSNECQEWVKMASIQLDPPSPFSFKTLDQWSKWKQRFDQYRLASGLSGEPDERQVSTLLYCMGEDAEDTFTSTNISEDDWKLYTAVLAKFDAFFQVRRNTIFECAKFNRGSQSKGEKFITSLYSLSKNCDFGAMNKEMIRDRIVVDIRNSSLSEQMQIDADLILKKAKKMVR